MTREAFSQSVAEKIRDRRKQLRMTQLALALAVGVKQSTVCAWESGSRTVSAYYFLRIRAAFERQALARKAKP